MDGTQFPVFTTRLGVPSRGPGKPGKTGFAQISPKFPDGIKGSGLWMLRGVGPEPRAFIEMIQPYPQRNGPLPKALLGLHDLWNQDKHRLVHLWGLVFVGERQWKISRPAHVNIVGEPWINPGVVKHGAILVKVACDPPCPEMKMELKSIVAVAVKGARGGGRRSADTTLTEMLFDTGAVIARLIEAIGHQDEPISMGPLYPRPDGPFADIQPQV